MRHGHIDLDLSHQEFLTLQNEDQVAEFNKLSDSHRSSAAENLLHRDGDPNPGGHALGEPVRIARDRISGLYFAKVADHVPSDQNRPHLERRAARLNEQKPFHVPGEGYWVPLKEIFPNHPHAASAPIREAHRSA